MTEQNSQTRMEQRIFELDLPVETVSIYLLCTGVSDSGKPLSFETLLSLWNGNPETLTRGLEALEQKGIIQIIPGDPVQYRVLPSSQWRLS
ncbi:MAG: hypothetical protein KKD44_13470 [Proteobacteria bacterium]|nr:hypothetical protein [Pseudomonadota bacterium]